MSTRRPRPAAWYWRRIAAWLIVCALLNLGAWLYLTRPGAAWARWEAAAKQAESTRRHQLLLQANQRNERDYVAFIQHKCGDESWYRPRDGAIPACTDKHGRRIGEPFTGVQP